MWYNEDTKSHIHEETMLRIAICDDTPEHAELLCRAFRSFGEDFSVGVQADSFEGFAELDKALTENPAAYRLLVLETKVGGEDGVAFAYDLRKRGCVAEILFFTSDRELALAAYGAYPMGYLLKPADRGELRDVFRFVCRRYERKPSLILKGGDGKRSGFAAEDIIYIEVFRADLEVHTVHGNVSGVGALADMYERLPKKQFYRSHRSFIVNLGRVMRVEKYRFVMENGDFVTIAKNRYAEAKKAWLAFCEEE